VSRFRASAASAALAAAFVGVALGARGGTQLERTAIVELLLVAAGASAVCAALLLTPRGRVHGAWTVVSFVALAAVTALSVGWSIAPDQSYVEAGRTLAYLALFAGAVAAARLWPTAAPVVLRGLLLATVAIAAYGLASRVWPGSFDESAFGGRIGLPFDYWNALAGVAAMGIVPALWLGTNRAGSAIGRALAYPVAGILIATVMITQARGALAGAAVGVALWLAIVPLRLRSLVVLAIAAAGATPVSAWAVSKDPFRRALEPLSAREALAGDFGLLLAATIVVLLAAGIAVEAVRSRHRPALRARVRAGLAVAVVAALVPLALLTSVAVSDRGLGGTISDQFDDLTNEDAAPPSRGRRIASVSSTRASYWREAFDAFEERPAIGLGAGSFELARLAYRDSGQRARRAHGFVPQTLSDLGIAGLLAVLALLATWLAAAARTTGTVPRRRTARPPWTTERSALVALGLAVVTYAIQAFADWTWFVPGLTALALVAAGYVAGRGPIDTALEAGPRTAAPRPSPPRIAAAIAVALTALLSAWAIWQPASAERAVARSYDLQDEGRPTDALREAEQAHDRNPYSNDPLYAEAAALADLGRDAAALAKLREAILAHPRDPEPWLRTASFELYTRDSPAAVLPLVNAAFRLDPYSLPAAALRDRATALIVERGGFPPSTTP
jgi:tetratricopeptide (TPR) repeat protein